jgi:hypothetical protein
MSARELEQMWLFELALGGDECSASGSDRFTSEERITDAHWMVETSCPCRVSTPDRPTHSLVTIATKLLHLIKSCIFFGVGHFCNVSSFAGSVATPSVAKAVFCSHSNLSISISSSHSYGGVGEWGKGIDRILSNLIRTLFTVSEG